MSVHLFRFLFGFIAIWLGAGLAIGDVDRLSKKLRFTSFAVSFLVLGFFTSISELSVGLAAVVRGEAAISAGNLLGASLVIFLLIIPLLAVGGRGLPMTSSINRRQLVLILVTIAAPAVLSFDRTISVPDAIVLLVLYGYMIATTHKEHSFRDFLQSVVALQDGQIRRIVGKMAIGVAIVLLGSGWIVNETIYFAEVLHISPFLVSILVISIGTNLPELAIAIRAIFGGQREIALGGYLGSSSFNTLLFGVITLLYGQDILMEESSWLPLIFLIGGLWLFFRYATSGRRLTRHEGWLMLSAYVLFLILEIIWRGVA